MLIDTNLIEQITTKAQASERKRMNFNFHETLESPCQCMLNTMLKGSKFDIHRHINTAETFVLLNGKIDLMYYNDKCDETERFHLDPTVGNYGIHIPAGQWHSLEIIEDCTIFETREGPYIPVNKDNGLILTK